jgi:maltooligosyltrehalose trehalohydrolase
MREWLPVLGAVVRADTTTFRVWAPERQRVDLVIERRVSGPADIRPLTNDRGYWSAAFTDVRPGDRYRYRIDGDEAQTFPDPVSRFQPHGVHGPSEVIDPRAFPWTDGSCQPRPYEQLIFYELHVGTFTPQGTFRAVIERLPDLIELGVTAIEIMPVGDFPGDRNWGYDGVAIFAPARCYGRPDDLRALVDAAHARGLAVFLDVVYNHLGPDGAYANAFSPHYFSNRHSSPWGLGVNLDGPHSEAVRAFFIENALHWVHEYHVDGLRLDATHALRDDGPRHFLEELTTTVRARSRDHVRFVAEDHRNLAQMLLPVSAGGFGIDGVWADDFHHQARVHTAHDHEGYYADFTGSAADLAATLRQGWFFTGQLSTYLNEMRGSDPSPLALRQFVICLQNHDQIGNRADGARLNQQIDPAAYRALSVLLLLAPETPLLFMGQEWAATTPFLFFTDHGEELGRRVTEGRRDEFSSFSAFRDPARRAQIPDPQRRDTFERSRLRWDERDRPPHAGVRRLYQRLLALRLSLPALPRDACDVRALDAHTVALSLSPRRAADRLLVVTRLAGDGEVTLRIDTDAAPQVVLTTEDREVVPDPLPIQMDGGSHLRLRFSRPGAIVLGSRLAT